MIGQMLCKQELIIHGKSNSQGFMLVCVNSPWSQAPQELKWAKKHASTGEEHCIGVFPDFSE